MDFNNMVDQVCMLTGLTTKAWIFKRYGYIEIEVNGRKVFYLQADQFYGTMVDFETKEEEHFTLKSEKDFADVLYRFSLNFDKEPKLGTKYILMYKNMDQRIFDFISLEEGEAKEVKNLLLNSYEDDVFEITVGETDWDSGTEIELEVENLFVMDVTQQEYENIDNVFGFKGMGICKEFLKYIKEYERKDEDED